MKSTDLNQVISAVINKSGNVSNIGVIMKHPDIAGIDICYPLKYGDTEIMSGSSYIMADTFKSVRPATDEEIRSWRNADGVAKSARKTANTSDKVKEIKWVASALRCGSKIINTL